MQSLSRSELSVAIDASPLLSELLQLPDAARYRAALEDSRGWRLAADERLGQVAEAGRAYLILASGDAENAPVLENRWIYGQWAVLTGGPLETDVSCAQPAIVLELERDRFELLTSTASSFKVAFYGPLLQTAPSLADAPEAALDRAIRASRFRFVRDNELVVAQGEYGNSMFFLLRGEAVARTDTEILGPLLQGDFFGEIALLSYGARSASVVAQTDLLVMECDRGGAFELRKKSKTFKAALDQRYRERAVITHLEQCDLFRKLDRPQIEQIAAEATVENFEPYEPIFFQGDPAEALYIPVNGTMTAVHETPEGTVPITWLRSGEMVGEIALLPEISGTDRRTLTITALQYVDAVRIETTTVRRVMEQFPATAETLRGVIEERQGRGLPESPARTAAMEWALDTQHLAGEAVLAVDMADCIRCGNCVTACQSVHADGQNRFFWGTMRAEENLLFSPAVRLSNSCQHCESPLCMRPCPTQCISRDASGGVYINYDDCIRCGKCGDPSQGCPYGSIQIVPAEKVQISPPQSPLERLKALFFPPRPAPTAETPKSGKNYPVKCDLCHDLPFQACVEHCPTSAVFRLDGTEHLTHGLTDVLDTPGASARDGHLYRYIQAEWESPPVAGRPAELHVTVRAEGPGVRVRCRKMEPGVPEMKLNFYMLAPESVRIGRGGELQQLLLPVENLTGALPYTLTGQKPGAVTLPICIYQGGFYLGRLDVEANFGAPEPRPAAPRREEPAA